MTPGVLAPRERAARGGALDGRVVRRERRDPDADHVSSPGAHRGSFTDVFAHVTAVSILALALHDRRAVSGAKGLVARQPAARAAGRRPSGPRSPRRGHLPRRSAAARQRPQRAARPPRAGGQARRRESRRPRARPEDAARRPVARSRTRRRRGQHELAAGRQPAGGADAATGRIAPRARARSRVRAPRPAPDARSRSRRRGWRGRCSGSTPIAGSPSTSACPPSIPSAASARTSTRCSAICSTTPASGDAPACRSNRP